MSSVIGIGGESIILKTSEKVYDEDMLRDTKLAVKASPCELEIEESIGYIDARLSKESSQLPELIPASFKHKNIIRYWRNVFQKAGPTLFHLSGMYLPIRITVNDHKFSQIVKLSQSSFFILFSL